MSGPMHVALVGAHGTGKTTLSKSLIEHLALAGIKVCSLPEDPRLISDSVGDPTFFRRGNNTPLRQAMILMVHMLQEFNSLSQDVDVVISDRSLLDHWIYTIYLFEQELVAEGVLDLYERFVVDFCQKYDLVFFLPIEFPVIDDGTREGDGEFQADIQCRMLELIQKYRIKALVVRGSLEQRVHCCMEALLPEVELRQKGGLDERASN